MTTRQERAGARLFVAADESRLILLNVTAPALPDTVKRVLRDMAMRRPDQFLALPPTGGFGQGTVRLGRAGIFVGDQKVADLEQVVETIDAREVREIHGPVVVHGTPLATVVSGVLGFFLGAGSQSLRAALIFGVAGGSLGYFFWESTSAGLIYTAP